MHEELARLGFPYAREVARAIIQEQVKTGGSALPWSDREAYTRLMLERSVEAYQWAGGQPGKLRLRAGCGRPPYFAGDYFQVTKAKAIRGLSGAISVVR